MAKKPETIINDAENYLSQDNHRDLLNLFLFKFSQCEVYCRPILKEYYENIGEPFSNEEIGLDSKTINTAFSEAGIYFTENKLLTRIFGKNEKPGTSSCRWLRNKITHELMLRAIIEVCERNTELIDDMNSFIQGMNNQS